MTEFDFKHSIWTGLINEGEKSAGGFNEELINKSVGNNSGFCFEVLYTKFQKNAMADNLLILRKVMCVESLNAPLRRIK